ncbi:MAG: hypothetical protein AAF628_30725 [Planctomycetota bacterium]
MTVAEASSHFLMWPRGNDEWEDSLHALLPHAEALWSRVQFTEAPRTHGSTRVCAVTGILEGDGASTTAAALAYYLAHGLGVRTLLVEADLRNPSLRRLGVVPRCPGLAGTLQREVRLRHVVFELPRVGFFVLPAGRALPSPTSLVNQGLISRMLSALGPHFEAIVLDCPPLNMAPEARFLIGPADTTIPVLRSGRVLPENAAYWFGKVTEYGGSIGAVCLNGVESVLPTKLRSCL